MKRKDYKILFNKYKSLYPDLAAFGGPVKLISVIPNYDLIGSTKSMRVYFGQFVLELKRKRELEILEDVRKDIENDILLNEYRFKNIDSINKHSEFVVLSLVLSKLYSNYMRNYAEPGS